MAENKAAVGCTLKFKITTEGLWDVKSSEEESDGHIGRGCVGGSKSPQANLLVKSSALVNSIKRRPDMCLDGHRSKKDLFKEKSCEGKGTEGQRDRVFVGGSKPSERISAKPSMAASNGKQRPSERQTMDLNFTIDCGVNSDHHTGKPVVLTKSPMPKNLGHLKSRPGQMQVKPGKTAPNGCSSLSKAADKDISSERSSDHDHSADFKLDCEVKGPGVALNEEKSPLVATTPVSNEGLMADVQMSPRKALRAAMLKSRFADTIFRATQALQDLGTKYNLSSKQQEKLRPEKEQLEEKGRIDAQIKAAEAATRRKELDDLKTCVGGSKPLHANLLVKSSALVNSGKRRPDMCLDGHRSKKQKMDLLEEKSREGTEGQRHRVFVGGSKPSERICAKPSMSARNDKQRPSKRQNMDLNFKLECGVNFDHHIGKPVALTKAPMPEKHGHSKSRPGQMQVKPGKTALNGCSSLSKAADKEHGSRRPLASANLRRSIGSTEAKCSCVSWTCCCPKNSASQTSTTTSDISLKRSSDHDHPVDFKLDCEVKGTFTSHANGFARDLDGPGVAFNEEKCPPAATIPVSNEGLMSDIQMSPRKAARAAMLKSRFADTIFRATHPTLEDRVRKELDDLKMCRERERKAARMALEKMERTVEVDSSASILKDLEMLCGLPVQAGYPSSKPLERLGLYLKDMYFDDDEDEDEDALLKGEEGEILY